MSATARAAAADAVTPDVVHANAILLSRGNPSTYARIYASGMAFIARRNAQRQEEREAALSAAVPYIMPDAGTRTYSEIPEAVRNDLHPQDALSIANNLASTARQRASDAEEAEQPAVEAARMQAYAAARTELDDLMLRNVEQFAHVDLSPYLPALGVEGFNHFRALQNDARSDRGRFRIAQESVARVRQISGQVFTAAVAGEASERDRRELRAQRTAFDMRLDRDVEAWRRTHDGAAPDPAQLRAMANALLQEGVAHSPGNGWFGRGREETRLFSTPPNARFEATMPPP